MTGTDLHEDFERLMAAEPPHRPLPGLVRAGERRLRSRRLSLGAGALALATIGVGVVMTLSLSGEGTTGDETGFADTSSQGAGPTVPPRPGPVASPADGHPLDPERLAGYTYGTYSPCGVGPMCDRYEFRSIAASRPVVAAIEFRLTDGNTKRVEIHDDAYGVVMTGTLPPGAHWAEEGLVDAGGQVVDLLAEVTLFAADGSVLATATPSDSDALDPYLAIMQ